MMKLSEIKRSVRTLTSKQLLALDAWLHELIKGHRAKKRDHTAGKRQVTHVNYRLERVRCGKESCKCAEGKLHGPYWYAYWTEGGKTRSQYVGKELPKGVKPPRDAKPRRVR